jgi:hypothetical protein
VIRRLLLVGVVLLGLMQLVPYGWKHPNPPVRRTATFPSAEAEALFGAACADCHSNSTDWPPYSYVAPMSWLVRHDVEEGRDKFNVDDWDRYAKDADDAAEELQKGKMPPDEYTLIHRDAMLSAREKQVLVNALNEMSAAR